MTLSQLMLTFQLLFCYLLFRTDRFSCVSFPVRFRSKNVEKRGLCPLRRDALAEGVFHCLSGTVTISYTSVIMKRTGEV
jgi:hypothetical protein